MNKHFSRLAELLTRKNKYGNYTTSTDLQEDVTLEDFEKLLLSVEKTFSLSEKDKQLLVSILKELNALIELIRISLDKESIKNYNKIMRKTLLLLKNIDKICEKNNTEWLLKIKTVFLRGIR